MKMEKMKKMTVSCLTGMMNGTNNPKSRTLKILTALAERSNVKKWMSCPISKKKGKQLMTKSDKQDGIKTKHVLKLIVSKTK